jgi:hypothetical protein
MHSGSAAHPEEAQLGTQSTSLPFESTMAMWVTSPKCCMAS